MKFIDTIKGILKNMSVCRSQSQTRKSVRAKYDDPGGAFALVQKFVSFQNHR